jgi:hypothetical protein
MTISSERRMTPLKSVGSVAFPDTVSNFKPKNYRIQIPSSTVVSLDDLPSDIQENLIVIINF